MRGRSKFGGLGECDTLLSADMQQPEYPEYDCTVTEYSQGSYELSARELTVYDAVWGKEEIGSKPYDEVLVALAHSNLFERLQHIEQLTLGQEYTTMPNTSRFSRWEHVWGSAVFVRKMLDGRDDIDDRQKMVLQLRTLLSDAGHTAYSHLGDWMFQGVNGGEDMHDQELKDILRVSGVEEVLRRHGFDLEETVFPPGHDWVECPAPDLCVDRLDYGFREMLRWVVPTVPLHLRLQQLQDPKSFLTIDEQGRLVMEQSMARLFAAGFSLLPTEHWSHPVHRLQLQLFQTAIQSALIDLAEDSNAHPRDALYGVDSDFMPHLATWPMVHLRKTMKDIGLSQRTIFVQGRRHDLDRLLANVEDSDWRFPEFPDPLQPYSWQCQQFGAPYPANIVIEESQRAEFEGLTATDRGLSVGLPPLKARAADPLISVGGQVVRLSEADPSYAAYLAGQKRMMAKGYTATVLMRPDIAQRIAAGQQAAGERWAKLLARPRGQQALKAAVGAVRFGHPLDLVRRAQPADNRTTSLLGRAAWAAEEAG